MTKMSETQRAVLTAAIARKDRCIYPMPNQLKGGAIAKFAGSLLKRGLVEEVPAGKNAVWRQCEDGKPLTLRATKVANQALGEAEEAGSAPMEAPQAAQAPHKAAPGTRSPRQRGSAQQHALVALLRRPEGATLAELQQATGWQPHSVRGALSGLIKKKLGHEVTSTKEERGRVYRISS